MISARVPPGGALVVASADVGGEALTAGASGFVVNDDAPEQLIAAIRTVAAGDALLSPAITKCVIRQFARIPRPTPPEELCDSLRANTRSFA
jgi:DNA-binding NarL/FixJ family response regulator